MTDTSTLRSVQTAESYKPETAGDTYENLFDDKGTQSVNNIIDERAIAGIALAENMLPAAKDPEFPALTKEIDDRARDLKIAMEQLQTQAKAEIAQIALAGDGSVESPVSTEQSRQLSELSVKVESPAEVAFRKSKEIADHPEKVQEEFNLLMKDFLQGGSRFSDNIIQRLNRLSDDVALASEYNEDQISSSKDWAGIKWGVEQLVENRQSKDMADHPERIQAEIGLLAKDFLASKGEYTEVINQKIEKIIQEIDRVNSYNNEQKLSSDAWNDIKDAIIQIQDTKKLKTAADRINALKVLMIDNPEIAEQIGFDVVEAEKLEAELFSSQRSEDKLEQNKSVTESVNTQSVESAKTKLSSPESVATSSQKLHAMQTTGEEDDLAEVAQIERAPYSSTMAPQQSEEGNEDSEKIETKSDGSDLVYNAFTENIEKALANGNEKDLRLSIKKFEDYLSFQAEDRDIEIIKLKNLPREQRDEKVILRIENLELSNAIDQKQLAHRKMQLTKIELARQRREIQAEIETLENEALSSEEMETTESEERKARVDGLKEKLVNCDSEIQENYQNLETAALDIAQYKRLLIANNQKQAQLKKVTDQARIKDDSKMKKTTKVIADTGRSLEDNDFGLSSSGGMSFGGGMEKNKSAGSSSVDKLLGGITDFTNNPLSPVEKAIDKVIDLTTGSGKGGK